MSRPSRILLEKVLAYGVATAIGVAGDSFLVDRLVTRGDPNNSGLAILAIGALSATIAAGGMTYNAFLDYRDARRPPQNGNGPGR